MSDPDPDADPLLAATNFDVWRVARVWVPAREARDEVDARGDELR
ncbi:MAG: hypothetical protein WBP71_22230 [Terracidiphilus sp.]